MALRVRVALVAFLVVALASACGSADHRAAAHPTSIVFEVQDECEAAFYTIHPDATALSRVISPRDCDSSVYVKPAGTKAFVIEPSGQGIGPYILDLRSGKKQPVAVDGLYDAHYPPDQPWSPTGKRLLLALGRPDLTGDDDVVYNPRTRSWTAVDDAKAIGAPVWGANGKSIIFPTEHAIDAARVNGGVRTVVRLPHGMSYPGSVGASADGKWISFVNGAGTALWVVHPNGDGLHRLARVDGGAWSPAGERFGYQDAAGVHVIDLARGRTVLVAPARGAVQPRVTGVVTPAWSPDGKWLTYVRTDLGFGAVPYDHDQIWVVSANGKHAHRVTQALPGAGHVEISATRWVAAGLAGKPVPRQPLIEPPDQPLLTTELPIVALGAFGARAVVATGFGRQLGFGEREVPAPRGPIIRIGPGGRTSQRQLPKGCVTVSLLALTATQLAYVCDNSQYEGSRDTVWLRGTKVMNTEGGQGVGTFLGGPATDGHTIRFGVVDRLVTGPPDYKFLPPKTQIYETRGSSARLVRTLPGDATLESIDGGRMALLRYGRDQAVDVVSRDGSTKTFRFRTEYLNGVALDGGRLVVANDGELTVIDLATGHRQVWPMADAGSQYGRTAFFSVRGDLVAYVVGAAVHVMRLTDGHEVVIDTPGATNPALAQLTGSGLFYAYNEAYAKPPGRLGFMPLAALKHAISAKGRQAVRRP